MVFPKVKKRGYKMRFGSVEFFKVLIKTVLAIAFFVPLILCIIFAVALWNRTAQLKETQSENSRITASAELLLSEKVPDIESFYEIYSMSGFSDEDFENYISQRNGNPPAENKGESAEANSAAPESNPVNSPESAEDKPVESTPATTTAAEPAAETEEAVPAATVPEDSPYSALYTDMYVTAPAETLREQGTVYLTFDDGPSNNTYSILSYLKEYNIKATFFVVPTRDELCYERLRAIAEGGHAIGVHSASHDYEKIYSSVDAYLADFYEAWNIIYEATGIKAEIFRFPGGSKNDFNAATRDDIIAEMTRRGFRFFDWNVDSNDAGGANWTEMYNSVPADIAQCYRAVVLMHDSEPRKNTVLVLEDIIHVLINEGYRFDKINNDTRPVQFIGPYA